MRDIKEFLKQEGTVFPGKTYVEQLLKPVFNDQRDFLFHVMFDIHRAHVIMLAEQKIIGKEEAKVMLGGINKAAASDIAALQYDPRFEDLFFMMEAKIGEEIGPELAGKIHIARSRNDMGVAMYRLVLRGRLLSLIENVGLLSGALLDKAEQHTDTYMTAYTHTQPAQPTTLGHYFLAVYDVLQRDLDRLWNAYHTVNKSPLGAAALTTTGFPISRERTAELLGFDGLVENSYDAIGGADYLLETASALMTLMVDSGRWIQDFLQQVTREFSAFHVADPYVQISSIMPQKRNPVSIEHSRSIASSAYGEALSAMNMIHNTPFGDIVDTEDDLQPHLYRSFDNANRVCRLMYAVIATLKVNKDHMRKMAAKSSITITELADTLAREYGVPFRSAHSAASRISKQTVSEGKELYEWKLEDLNILLGETANVTLSAEEWAKIISPEYFVGIRGIRGGPSPAEAGRMIRERREQAAGKTAKYDSVYSNLVKKDQHLKMFNWP